jgi:hypothetical protein
MRLATRTITRFIATAVLVGGAGACGSRTDLAARVGDRGLTVERLAEILGRLRGPAVDTSLARQVTQWWVEYQVFAERVVAGDSMLDSATVVEVLWPQARAQVLARWRQQLFADQLPLDSASLDSVYQAGDYRLIQHVLFQAPVRGSAEARERARTRGEALRRQLTGGLTWDAAQRQNDDLAARGQRGSVGVITRGQTEPEFEQAAFALEPGAISLLIATSFGYHIVRRPPLREVRAEYRAAVEPLVAERLDSLHIRELVKQWRLAVRPGGLEQVRAAVRDPFRYQHAETVFATHDRGNFTLADVVRWLAAVPDWIHTRAERDPERSLSLFLDMMMGYELLYREALDHGVTTSPDELAELKRQLAGRLSQVQTTLGIFPPSPGDSLDRQELARRAAEKIDAYFNALPNDWQRFARVPPTLAVRLKQETRWGIYRRGIECSVRRARELAIPR